MEYYPGQFGLEENIPDIDLSSSVPTDYSIAINENTKMENPKTELAGLATDFVMNEMVAKNINTKDGMVKYSKFLKCVFDVFENRINAYTVQHKMHPSDILFLYKGGCLLRIAYLHYKEYLIQFYSSLTNTLDHFDQYFKISDADFTIVINPDINANVVKKNFSQILSDMNKLTYNCLLDIRAELIKNRNEYFDFFSLEPNVKIEKLKKLSNDMNNTVVLNNKKIGMSNMPFLGSEVVDLIFDREYYSLVNPKTTKITKEKNGKFSTMNIPTDSNRFDSFVRFHHNVYVPQKKANMDASIIFTNKKEIYPQLIYVTYNDSLDFEKSAYDKKYASFNLVRAKFNFVVILKELDPNAPATTKNKYFKHNIGGELIDVSIIKGGDISLYHVYDDLTKYVCYYEGIGYLKGLKFYGFTLQYLFHDIYLILFDQRKYFWLDEKYAKRVKRTFALMMLLFAEAINPNNYMHIQKYFEDLKRINAQANILLAQKYTELMQVNPNMFDIKNYTFDLLDTKDTKEMMQYLYDMFLLTYNNLFLGSLTDKIITDKSTYTQLDAYLDFQQHKMLLYNGFNDLIKFVETLGQHMKLLDPAHKQVLDKILKGTPYIKWRGKFMYKQYIDMLGGSKFSNDKYKQYTDMVGGSNFNNDKYKHYKYKKKYLRLRSLQ